jgi:hypothetical protein
MEASKYDLEDGHNDELYYAVKHCTTIAARQKQFIKKGK